MKFGLAIDVGTTTVVSTLIELESGEQLASVSRVAGAISSAGPSVPRHYALVAAVLIGNHAAPGL
jgi:uncharacterized 2Fe-2S/4Fe-4S cluster protein (DUF4445 family)